MTNPRDPTSQLSQADILRARYLPVYKGGSVGTRPGEVAYLEGVGTGYLILWTGTEWVLVGPAAVGGMIIHDNVWHDPDYEIAGVCVPNALYDGNTILKADADNVPEALPVAEQRLVGRITGGEIAALTAAQVITLLGGRLVYIKEVIASDLTLTTGDGKDYWVVPSELNGYNLINAQAAVYTPSTSGEPSIQVVRIRGVTPVDMLSVNITIDINEYTSYSADPGPTINPANDDVVTADRLRVDLDAAGTGTKGLDVVLTFAPP